MTLLRFTASWCRPCHTAGPLIDALAARAGVPVTVVDVDTEPAVAELHAVRSVPSVRLLDADGGTVYTGSGVECLPALAAALA